MLFFYYVLHFYYRYKEFFITDNKMMFPCDNMLILVICNAIKMVSNRSLVFFKLIEPTIIYPWVTVNNIYNCAPLGRHDSQDFRSARVS